MHAFLLETAQSPEKIDLKSIIPSQFESSIYYQVETIAAVRDLKKALLFSPKEKLLCVICGVDEAKDEAQNALLKILEEPPHENLLFLLTVKNPSRLISTVLSRLTVVKDKAGAMQKELAKNDLSFLSLSKVTDRDEAIALLESEKTEEALQTIEALKKNGNVSLQLTNYLLSSLL